MAVVGAGDDLERAVGGAVEIAERGAAEQRAAEAVVAVVAIGAVGHLPVRRAEIALGAEGERVLGQRAHREAGAQRAVALPDVELALQVAGDHLERAVAVEIADRDAAEDRAVHRESRRRPDA